ncbi:kinase-like domain-containing protein [Aspergillus heterothallicus]
MSRPPTPCAESPVSPAEWRFHPLSHPTEWIEDYRPGKYHPVHFGDTLKDSRYCIIRKMGYGSFSTVWLAKDRERSQYVALKILIASAEAAKHEIDIMSTLSQTVPEHIGKPHVMTLADIFEHTGPNGVHRCIVFGIMGPSVAAALQDPSEALARITKGGKTFPIWMAKLILYQTLLGIDFLHHSGVAHGDLQQGNLLFSVKDLESVSEVELARDDQISEPVRRKDERTDHWAPKYLALSQPLDEYIYIDPGFQIKISDLGGAFFLTNPPSEVVTPVALRSPELVFTNTINKDQDVWSFGCLILELFTGRHLFLVTDMDDDRDEVDDDHFLQFHDVLGPIPHPLWSKYPRAHIYYNEQGEKIRNYIGELPEGFDPATIEPMLPLERAFDEEKPGDMSADDADNVKRVLRWILDYDPGRRPSAAELLRDPWFVAIGATTQRPGKV